jgi:hypothetical protein
MKDIQAHLDKIRSDAAECLLVSTLVGDGKREVFAKTAQHLNALALEVEKTIATNTADKGPRGESEHKTAHAEDREETVATNIAAAHHSKTARPRQILPWFLIIVIGSIVGTLVWVNNPPTGYSFLSSLHAKQETPPAPQDETKQAIAALLSGEQAERKILMEQVSGLGARLDNLARALENLRISRAEIVGPSSKESIGAEEKPLAAETTPSAPGEKSVHKDENPTPILESPALAKQPDAPRATDSPLVEPADRVGAIPIPARRAELDQRKPTIGPAGCTQFRSFDPVSGTYTTLDGRRRQCR